MIAETNNGIGNLAPVGSAVGSGLMTAALIPSPASPFLLVAGAVTELVSSFFHPDMKKIATTQIVNQAEQVLKKNLNAWQQVVASGKVTSDEQQAAMQNFESVWQQVVAACGSGQYGKAGQNCIGDRQRGGKWDWFKLYYDPIASYQVPAISNSVVSSLVSGFAGGNGLLLIGGGLLALLLVSE